MEERFAALERRVQRLEDELEVTRLVASYGPLVDAGEADAVAALWAEDGQLRRRGLARCAAATTSARWCAPTGTSA